MLSGSLLQRSYSITASETVHFKQLHSGRLEASPREAQEVELWVPRSSQLGSAVLMRERFSDIQRACSPRRGYKVWPPSQLHVSTKACTFNTESVLGNCELLFSLPCGSYMASVSSKPKGSVFYPVKLGTSCHMST